MRICNLVVYRWCPKHDRVEKSRCTLEKGHKSGCQGTDPFDEAA